MRSQELGQCGEDLAAAFLEAQGYTILERNYRFERAEVDLICFEPNLTGGEIVFVEVKTRSGTGYGRPEEAVSEGKQQRVAKAAEAYLYESRLEGAISRFDVVSIVLRQGAEPDIEHLRDAFWAP